MAEKPRQAKSLHELRQEAAHSRDRLARDLTGLRYELDFPLKFRKSFQRQTVLWIGAAIIVGVVFAVLPARTKKIQVKTPKAKDRGEKQKEGMVGAGLALGALKLVATMLKPTVTAFVAKKMSGYAAGASAARRS
jgi:mannose/fructose/N-acetylgalactosamine-specific phosphotransferase system component IIC